MKKTGTLGKMATALLVIGAGVLGSVSPTSVTANNATQQPPVITVTPKRKEREVKPVSQMIEIKTIGGVPLEYYDFGGTSPKQYGEYLQRTGRQKWCRGRK